jgi:ABC-type antimicrobial peptide transport system permease subunit
LIIFSCIAIGIGCLGLYGLISFIATQKEKEIGIRKVLGATTSQIMVIFSREFVGMILIAFFIAAPLAGWIMNKWLQNYEYRISMEWTMFIWGILATFIIALITVGYRSLRASTTNPIDSLRSE